MKGLILHIGSIYIIIIIMWHFLSAQVIEGVDVLRELRAATRSGGASSESPQNDSHIISHIDYITSLAIMPYKSPQNVTQQFLISSSHDGVIKLWK